MVDAFRPGSIVQLKSGGPTMTINWIETPHGVTNAYCEWFVAEKAPWKKEGAVFPVTSLKLLEP
jgi:uncharacterized protein YodC (DUF2158 family)